MKFSASVGDGEASLLNKQICYLLNCLCICICVCVYNGQIFESKKFMFNGGTGIKRSCGQHRLAMIILNGRASLRRLMVHSCVMIAGCISLSHYL